MDKGIDPSIDRLGRTDGLNTNPPHHPLNPQVYTALEKKALALIQLEENKQKEATILANFRKALESRLDAKGKAEGADGEGADA